MPDPSDSTKSHRPRGLHLNGCCLSQIHERIVLDKTRESESGCWIVLRYSTPTGYHNLRHQGETWSFHRFSYETFIGPIPSGYVVDHLCRNPSCAHPDHLEAVPQQSNVARGRLVRQELAPITSPRHLPESDPRHGKSSSYTNWSCRCAACKAAHAADMHVRYLRRQAAR